MLGQRLTGGQPVWVFLLDHPHNWILRHKKQTELCIWRHTTAQVIMWSVSWQHYNQRKDKQPWIEEPRNSLKCSQPFGWTWMISLYRGSSETCGDADPWLHLPEHPCSGPNCGPATIPLLRAYWGTLPTEHCFHSHKPIIQHFNVYLYKGKSCIMCISWNCIIWFILQLKRGLTLSLVVRTVHIHLLDRNKGCTQCIQKVLTPLDLSHILLCYSLNLKWIQLKCFVTGLHTRTSKCNYVFQHFYKIITTVKS